MVFGRSGNGCFYKTGGDWEMKNIIILSGKKQSGKDTFAKFFNKRWCKFAFAWEVKNQLYTFLADILDIPVDNIYMYDNKDNKLRITLADGTEWTNRQALQWYGQMMKQQFGQNYWANKIINDLKFAGSKQDYILTDCRFPYEADGIKEAFQDKFKITTIYINRLTGLVDNDISENSISPENYKFDFVVDNNGSLEDLKKEYERIMLCVMK